MHELGTQKPLNIISRSKNRMNLADHRMSGDSITFWYVLLCILYKSFNGLRQLAVPSSTLVALSSEP